MAISYTDVTISGGVLALNGTGHYRVETEGAAASDEIESVTGLAAFDIVALRPRTSGQWFFLTHRPANGIYLEQGAPFVTDSLRDRIIFRASAANEIEEEDRSKIPST